MKHFEDWAQRTLVPLAAKINSIKIIASLRDGMVFSLPIMLTGAVFMILANFPYLDKLSPSTAAAFATFFGPAGTLTLGMLAFPILIGVSSAYADQQGVERTYGVIMAFVAFLMVLPFESIGDVIVKGKTVHGANILNSFPFEYFGSQAIITVIIISLVSVKIYSVLVKHNITIKMPEQVPPYIAHSFTVLIPFVIVLSLFLVIRQALTLTSWGSFQAMIYALITTPLMKLGTNIFAFAVLNVIQQLLWVLGIHGTSVVSSITAPVLQTAMTANLEAFKAGQALPYVLSQPFFDTYLTGGACGILSAVVAALIVGKSRQTRTISKMSLPVATFNIQETFHFGFPTFMNPITMIPYIFIPVIQLFIAYFGVASHIFPEAIFPVPWTTPIVISGFLASGSIMGSVLQLIEFGVGVILWIPFIKVQDMRYVQDEIETEKQAQAEKAVDGANA